MKVIFEKVEVNLIKRENTQFLGIYRISFNYNPTIALFISNETELRDATIIETNRC